MIKISWSESELFSLVTIGMLVFIKTGTLLLFCLLIALNQISQSSTLQRSSVLIIPSNGKKVMKTVSPAQSGTSHQKIGTPLPLRPTYQSISVSPKVSTSTVTSPPTLTQTLTPSLTSTSTLTPTSTITLTLTPTHTSSPISTSTLTNTLTMTPIPTETATRMATETPTATKTATAATIILPTPTLVGMDTVTPIPLFPWVQSASQMCSPLGGITIYELVDIVSAPYTGPPPGSDDRHEGVDFAYYNRGEKQSIEGVSVNSILPGRVVSVIKNRAPYGNMVIVETGYKDVAKDLAGVFSITPQKSLYHLYAHMKNTPAVVMGQTVGCGDIIGEVGSTGTNVSHLHFETRYGPPGGWFPVMGFFDLDATEEEKSNYVYWRTSWTYQHFNPMDIITAYEKYLESK